MACDTERRSFDRNISEAVVLECARFIFGSFVRRRVLHCFFSTWCGVIIGALLRDTTKHVLMGFKVNSGEAELNQRLYLEYEVAYTK